MSGMTKTAVIDVAGAAAKVHSVSMQITNLIFLANMAYGNLSLSLDIAFGKVFLHQADDNNNTVQTCSYQAVK